MALVRLRAPLSELRAGSRELQLEGATVRDVLCALEDEHPAIAGWILDERVTIREHVNVFVNGEEGARTRTSPPTTASTSFPRSPEVRNMTELLVGTKKGLFALQGDDGPSRSPPARSPASRSSSRCAIRAAGDTSPA